MLALHCNPIEISSPELVLSPLWQATHRSDVRKKVPGGVLSPFAFSVCDWPRSIAGTPTAAKARIATPQPSLIATLPIASHRRDPKAYKTAPAGFCPPYS